MMECSAFERQVDRCLEGTLSPEELRAFNLHRAVCSRCADLMAIIEGGSSGRAPEIPPGLTRSILDSTLGGGCAGIRLHLCDYVDRTLAEGRLAEIEAHLRDCPPCQALTRMLRELQPLLLTLASVPEDTRVTERILARTSQSRPGHTDWRTRLRGLFHRPRIGLEAAFVGALLFFTLLAVPAGSWNQGPEFVVTAFRDGFQQVRATAPLALTRQVLPPYERTWTRVSSQVRASTRPERRSVLTRVSWPEVSARRLMSSLGKCRPITAAGSTVQQIEPKSEPAASRMRFPFCTRTATGPDDPAV